MDFGNCLVMHGVTLDYTARSVTLPYFLWEGYTYDVELEYVWCTIKRCHWSFLSIRSSWVGFSFGRVKWSFTLERAYEMDL